MLLLLICVHVVMATVTSLPRYPGNAIVALQRNRTIHSSGSAALQDARIATRVGHWAVELAFVGFRKTAKPQKPNLGFLGFHLCILIVVCEIHQFHLHF